ncbi:amino acid ABC transporter permease [Paraburkholderia sp. UYCP14C]|uniref:amino acid ABC transporter permease n=1 Tax=Paraburkholderia sp. UYCP14C TaxID=2511130 RepID=UPI00102012EF|nr:amino acid ABC transporter permease [Paraburkholderia sp. UYCP14C]RZF24211.1 amino acid ABC transporter permease [Paraburkholderia sp. UYCP14C]
MDLTLLVSPDLWMGIARGVRVTLLLTILSMVLGLALGTVLALMRQYGNGPAKAISGCYVFLFRGVPLLILLYFLYYGAPQFSAIRSGPLWGLIFSSAFSTCVLAFTLNNAAYLAEVVRGGMLTIKKGEIEAGYAIGLSGSKVARRIVLPLAFRSCLYSIGNEAIFTIKASAVASVVTVRDLMGEAQRVGVIYSDNLTPLLATVLVYVILVQIVEWFIRRLRRYYYPHQYTKIAKRGASAKDVSTQVKKPV